MWGLGDTENAKRTGAPFGGSPKRGPETPFRGQIEWTPGDHRPTVEIYVLVSHQVAKDRIGFPLIHYQTPLHCADQNFFPAPPVVRQHLLLQGLDTETPFLQMDRYTFTGEYKDTIGTDLIFEKILTEGC